MIAEVREHPVEALILPEDVAADQRYGAMGLDPRSSVGLSTSMACEDHNLGSQVIPGKALRLKKKVLSTLRKDRNRCA